MQSGTDTSHVHDNDVILQVEGLSCRRDGRAVLRDVSLTVPRGQYIALMGPNGSGKTTLIRHLNGLLAPETGSVHVHGTDTSNPEHLAEIRQQVGLVFQDPDDQMVAVNVEDEIAFGLEVLRWDRDRMKVRVAEALERFNLTHVRERATTSLSGGEQQRVAIAAIWATDPALMILDEPTSMLDRPSAVELLATLESMTGTKQGGEGRTVIHVTQSVEEARQADRVIVMRDGAVILDGSPDDVLADEDHLRSIGIMRKHRSAHDTGDADSDTPCTIEAEDLVSIRCDGPDERQVLNGISACVRKGQVLAIVGRSGSGKTTLAWHFNRLFEPTKGRVLLGGEDIARMKKVDVRRRVGLTFQRVDLQLFEATVLEDIAFGLIAQGTAKEQARERAAAMLDSLGLPSADYGRRRPVSLSVGEQRRVALAGVLVTDPDVLVFDEPTSGLDARGVDALVDIVLGLKKQGRAVAVVTHDLAFARTVADAVLFVHDGHGEQSSDVEGFLNGITGTWNGRHADDAPESVKRDTSHDHQTVQ